MFSSLPIPFQAIVWPLIGAALILATRRLLPNWARRLLAMMAALASLVVLWALRAGPAERVELYWEPLNLFRMSPLWYADALSLLGGLLLAGTTFGVVLGIRGQKSRTTVWHGLTLIALTASLAMAMAANLLALALGSALLDLALLAIVVSTTDGAGGGKGMPMSVAVPGIASTLILFLGALQMDVQVGHASLLSQKLPEGGLVLVGVAGVVRSLVFPLHPRRQGTPEMAATLLLPVGVGGLLLTRVQTLAPVQSGHPWLLAVAVIALLAGGLLAWSGGGGSTERSGFWPGALVHQTGFTLTFLLVLAGAAPWPLVSLIPALGALAIWWDSSREKEAMARPGWLSWISHQASSWWAKALSYSAERVPVLARWDASRFTRRGRGLLLAVALGSLAGAPLTAGARARWPFYAAWLRRGDATLLIILAADTFLTAGLWIAARAVWMQAREHRPGLAPQLAMIALIIPLLVLGIAPGILGEGVRLKAIDTPDVSRWGLGLLYVLPWLLGAWLARTRSSLSDHLASVRVVVNLDWLYRGAGWVGRRLESAGYWLGKVGEGDGWWGWVLIILALGVILLQAR
ncbi:MAG: hypothetical protein P8189_04505 [Anaerolineae bacterium]